MDSLTRREGLKLPDIGIGHNAGPPMVQSGWHLYAWKRARKAAWKAPPIEVVRRRAKRARELGMTYKQYTLEILERGRYL
ncbi:hypothetical protein [Pelagibius sp.]|uniref:hypothetical protein n=1 Tax=Pelagibius sp. TaxID=1931238 RepID=UPI002637AD1B|nr:hypothetical protein [Pelagibius sp.]